MSEIEKDTSNIELSVPNKLLTISNAYKNGEISKNEYQEQMDEAWNEIENG